MAPLVPPVPYAYPMHRHVPDKVAEVAEYPDADAGVMAPPAAEAP